MMTEDEMRDTCEMLLQAQVQTSKEDTEPTVEEWAEHNKNLTVFQQYLLLKIGAQRDPDAEFRKLVQQLAIDIADGMVPEERSLANAVAIGFGYGYQVACQDIDDPRLPGGPYIV